MPNSGSDRRGGFLGSRLARELLALPSLPVAGGAAAPLARLTLLDRAPVAADLGAVGRVTAIRGVLADPAWAGWDALGGADLVFHLAAAVSGECEADFDLGLRANLDVIQALLAACRGLGTTPVVVFASSLAVFGASAEHPLPEVIDDHTLPNPQTSYGTQKLIAEQLLADYTRKGFLAGRAVRLLTVSVRPGRPNQAADPVSCPASSASRWPAAAPSARCRRGPRWPWSPRRGPSTPCCAPPLPPIRPGAAAPRSRCPRSPCESPTWSPRWTGPPVRRRPG